jgi:hypothetical protein
MVGSVMQEGEQDGTTTVRPIEMLPRMFCCKRCLDSHDRGHLYFGMDFTCIQWGHAFGHCDQGHEYEVVS